MLTTSINFLNAATRDNREAQAFRMDDSGDITRFEGARSMVANLLRALDSHSYAGTRLIMVCHLLRRMAILVLASLVFIRWCRSRASP